MPEFARYPDIATQYKAKAWDQFYLSAMKAGKESPLPQDRVVTEFKWWKAGRPYYNCYPAITPMLTKLRLDIPMTDIVIPHKAFLVRLRDDDPMIAFNSPSGAVEHCKAIMFSQIETRDKGVFWSMMATIAPIGKKIADSKLFLGLYQVKESVLIEEAQSTLVKQMTVDVDPTAIEQALKLCCTICLLGRNEELLTADVLAADRVQYDDLRDEFERTESVDVEARLRLIEDRAQRRGKTGWCIGRVLESSPHWRNPHPCLVHHGEGKKLKKVIIRKGCVVNPEKATTVPSEYFGSSVETARS